ncbi:MULTISPECIES: hypothetical protein [Lysobacter]|uniref:hypothetical protein n=1 Tax=Lysobacter TaxID=68 RepID=UPI001F3213D4|nr:MULTISPECIES: hypothetical protein [Lysobacter]UJB21287.1 hypothetical protein L1A79_09645 [Lysobacter capsici]UJQ29597.1 hypothetical protein L2D09_05215 [Lysobacter gummosus]
MEVSRLRAYLERAHWPRLQMSLIVLVTGAIGFLASYWMLNSGLQAMWLRYPLAAGLAYLAFMVLLWTWARTHGRDFWDNFDLPDFGSGSNSSGSGGYSPQWQSGGGQSGGGDWSPAEALDDAVWVLVALAIAAVALLAMGWVIWIAPGLMAELLLDVALAGGLYRRLRRIESRHWLSTVLRRTALPFLGVALIAGLAGYAGAHYAPGADSIGDVIAAHAAR